jgi:hypothetical protein
MSDMIDADAFAPVTRICQIIIGALVTGVVIFLAIAILVNPAGVNHGAAPPLGQEGEARTPALGGSSLPIITYLAVAVGILDLALSFIIPRVSVARACRQIAGGKWPAARIGSLPCDGKQIDPASDEGKLIGLYQTQLITGAALLEGAAFFAAIAYMLERTPIALGVAGVLLGVLLARFPTGDRIRGWMDRQLEVVQKERQSVL